jgi:MFS family permease
MVYSFVYVQNNFSLPLMMKTLFQQKSPIYMGYVMSINALTVLSLTTLITVFTKKIPFLVNITAAGVFYAIGFGMVGLLSNYLPLLLCSTVLWTIGEILDATNSGIFIANNCRPDIQARYSALVMITGSIGKALGTLVMGGYIKKMGVTAVWPFIMVIALCNAFLIYLLYVYLTKNKTVTKRQIDEAV